MYKIGSRESDLSILLISCMVKGIKIFTYLILFCSDFDWNLLSLQLNLSFFQQSQNFALKNRLHLVPQSSSLLTFFLLSLFFSSTERTSAPQMDERLVEVFKG